jgi:CBS domain-containing protein
MMLVDDRNLFMFKSAPLSDVSNESFFYLNDTFFTNDKKSSERVSEMLNDTWKRGMDLSEILTQAAGMKLPTLAITSDENVTQLVGLVLKNNVDSVLITDKGEPVGIINDRDLLKEVVEAKKDPQRTLVRDLDYTPLLTLNEGQSITDALKIIREKGAKRIAVVKNGQLIGMLTQDLARAGNADAS